jgi:hypothetical protein
LNNGYYETLDENFKQALNLFEQDYSHHELIELLKNGNIVQKQVAALRLETILSDEDAQVLIDNLTGQDGKVREAVSLKIKEFLANDYLRGYFDCVKNYQVFLNAVIDINGNICRNIIAVISYLKKDSNFCNLFCKALVELCFGLLDKISKFDIQDGKYTINKEVFKLYWCLETVFVYWDKINFEDLKAILLKSKNVHEYTIREKVAKILSLGFNDNQLLKAQKELQLDENYYVRNFKN